MKVLKRIISYLFIAVLLLGFLPAAAAADDDRNVLTSVTHIETGTYTLTGADRNITLTVPSGYAGSSVDLSVGLDITSSPAYKNVVASPPLSPDSVAVVGGSHIPLTVTYNLTDEPDGAPKGQTIYHVYVVRAAAVPSSFSGTLLKHFAAPGSVDFLADDLAPEFQQFYSKNDGTELGAISITGSNPSFGTLKRNGGNYIFGDKINIADIGQLMFSASSTGTVSYDVKAYSTGSPEEPIGNVVLTITAYAAPEVSSAIADTISKGTVMTFTPAYFATHCNLYGMPLEAIEITPLGTTLGTWAHGGTAFTAARTIPAAQLGSLTFTANSTGTVAFTWRVTTEAGTTVPGAGTFTIESPKLTLAPYAGATIMKGSTWPLSLAHFVYTPSTVDLSYIKVTVIPPAADGSLYLTTALPKDDVVGYPAIAANTALKAGAVIPASYISYLRFSTKNTSTKDSVAFTWTATTDNKISSATWGDAVPYTVNFITAGVLQYTVDMNIPLPFMTSYNSVTVISSDISSRFQAATGSSLSYVTFTLPDKNSGALYLNYDVSKKTGTAVAASGKYYTAKSPNLANITFVPAKDYTGTLEISYNAYMENGAYITGTLRITIYNNPGGTISYVTDKNSPIQLDAKDFQAAFLSATGKPLSHVYFSLPASGQGALYYDYTLSGDFQWPVSSAQKYNVYAPYYLSLVTFVPYSNFKNTAVISYTGYTETGAAYSGRLYIFVADSPAGIVRYQVKENGTITLSGADFSNEFIGVTGSLMSYVTFTPSADTSGSLYYQYDASAQTGTKVTSATKYYDGKGPDISAITFVPAKNFVGTVVVTYTAFTAGGASYAGKLKFTVYEGAGVISYNTESGKKLVMNTSDFLSAFAANSGGKSLSSVTFEIPSATYGRFYYNYTSPSHFDSVVSGDRKYYVSSSPYLSNVSFIPNESYTGSFTVAYTGYTSTGASVTGKIKITVNGTQNGAVTYETNSLTPLTFSAADFIAAFTRKSGNPLSYVRFTPPNTSYGTLFYGYNPQSSYNTPVQPASYYYTTQLSTVTFVPNTDFSGALAISYTAVDTSGYAFTDTLLITVKSSDIGTITYDTDINAPVVFNSDDFNAAFLNKTGSSLHYVTFTLPPSSSGALYLGYASPSSYVSAVTAAGKYYRSFSPLLSDITFVPRAGFYGTVTISYTAYTTANTAYRGKIIISVGMTTPFTDITAPYAWAKEAVAYLYRNGVVLGTGDGKFNPANNISRGDFVLMVANAFSLTNSGTGNFPDVPSGSYYYDAIAAAKALGIVSGAGGKFSPGAGLTRQDAMVIIINTLDAVGKPLNPGSMSDLYGFSDASQVTDYAVSSVGALVRAGLISGSNGKLNPKSMISRAEMAVILYNVLTA